MKGDLLHMTLSKSKLLTLKVFCLSISMFSFAFPASAGVFSKLGTSLTSELNAIIPVILLAVGGYFLVTRDWMKMISFIGIALAVAVFMNWEYVQAMAKKFYDAFMA